MSERQNQASQNVVEEQNIDHYCAKAEMFGKLATFVSLYYVDS